MKNSSNLNVLVWTRERFVLRMNEFQVQDLTCEMHNTAAKNTNPAFVFMLIRRHLFHFWWLNPIKSCEACAVSVTVESIYMELRFAPPLAIRLWFHDKRSNQIKMLTFHTQKSVLSTGCILIIAFVLSHMLRTFNLRRTHFTLAIVCWYFCAFPYITCPMFTK